MGLVRISWTLENIPIKEIHENRENPRTMGTDASKQLLRSMEEYGLCQPLVINSDGTLIGGHQRLRGLKKMGYKTVDVYRPDKLLSIQQCKELGIRLNKNVGEFDFDMLANHFEVEDLLEWGFDEKELEIDADVIKGEDPDTESVSTFAISGPDCNSEQIEYELMSILSKYPEFKMKKNKKKRGS